jgi:hypothetical protein
MNNTVLKNSAENKTAWNNTPAKKYFLKGYAYLALAHLEIKLGYHDGGADDLPLTPVQLKSPIGDFEMMAVKTELALDGFPAIFPLLSGADWWQGQDYEGRLQYCTGCMIVMDKSIGRYRLPTVQEWNDWQAGKVHLYCLDIAVQVVEQTERIVPICGDSP